MGEKEKKEILGEKMSRRYRNQEEHLLHLLKPESFGYQASFLKIQMFPRVISLSEYSVDPSWILIQD